MASYDMLFLFSVIYMTGSTIGDNGSPDIKITTTQETKHVLDNEGKSLLLGCRIEGSGFDFFDTPVVWKKVVAGVEYKVNVNRVIQKPYSSTKRYQIVRLKNPDFTDISLNISNIRLEDNGTYICEVSNVDGLIDKVQHEIIVYSDIHEISFTSGNKTSIDAKNGMTFTLNDGETVPLTCVSKGGNPKPMMHIYKDATDITAWFDAKDTISPSGPEGRQSFNYTVTMDLQKFKVTQEDDGKVLKCEAVIHNVPEKKSQTFSRMTSAIIQVRYGPKFQCKKEMVAPKDEENFEMECVVHANPPVQPDELQWHLPKEKITMRHGESANNYSVEMTKMDNGNVKAVLTIANVTDQSYQIYHLKAENDVSEEIHKIKLVQASKSTDEGETGSKATGSGYNVGAKKTDNGATCITLSLSTFILALFSRFLFN